MMLVNFSLEAYLLVIGTTFFIIVLDNILTNINARLYTDYYKLEILPLNKLAYYTQNRVIALFLTFIINIGLLVLILVLNISITWTVVFAGFWIYRLWHSIMRLWYWRKRLRGR